MKIRNSGLSLITVFLIAAIFAGCSAASNTVESCVISNEQYTDKAGLESAKQQETFEADKDIFASVYFIESPKGMEYTGKWYIDGAEVKTEQKEMTSDTHGVIVFSLAADKLQAGTLRFEIVYGDDVLLSREMTVQ